MRRCIGSRWVRLRRRCRAGCGNLCVGRGSSQGPWSERPMAEVVEGAQGKPEGQVADRRAVETWLYIVAALVVAMVAVGGATRVTGPGLSITEGRRVTGAIPPLSHESWVAEFQRYQASPQYRLLNEGMDLAEFQFIYCWEWSHRQLGRLIGFVFFVPLLWFWLRGVVRGRLALGLLGIGALGGLQAGIGWIMVASGLQPGMVAVAPIKLMLHLIVASLILALLVWVAAGFGRTPERDRAAPAPARWTALFFLGLVVLQI